MFRLLVFFVILLLYSSLYAEEFYKWKDKNGKVHITDYLPDGVEIMNDNKAASFNKIKSNTFSNQNHNNAKNLQENIYRSKSENIKNNLDSKITDAKNKYDFCVKDMNSRMTPKSPEAKSEHRQRKKMCDSLYKEYAYLLTLTSDNEFIDQKIEALSKIKSITPKRVDSKSQYTNSPPPHVIPPPQHGVTDQYGVFYAPTGNGNFVNTRTGASIIHQGGSTYLNTRTGKTMLGH